MVPPSPGRIAASALCVALSALSAERGVAQSQGLVVRDGSLGSGPLAVPSGIDPLGQPASYLIGPELGVQRGGNLFHSFQRFGVGIGESATFTGPDPVGGSQSVSNVIARVTGGSASQIDGSLRSTIPGADLTLLNPHGIAFGSGASLDVPGSLHVGVADAVDFTEPGERFHADPSLASTLSTASPASFGFLGASAGQDASLSIAGSVLAVPPGETLSLVARDGISLAGARLSAPAGHVGLEASGEVALAGTTVDAGGAAPGSVAIRSGRLVVQQGSRVLAENRGAGPGGEIGIEVDESVLVDDSLLAVTAFAAGDAGTLRLAGGDVVFRNGPGSVNLHLPLDHPANLPGVRPVGASADTVGAGAAGTLEIEADRLEVSAGAVLGAATLGENATGDGGLLRIRAGTLSIEDRGFVSAGAWGSQGDGGTVEIRAGEVRVDGALDYAVISSDAIAPRSWALPDDVLSVPGAPGLVDIAAGSVEVRNGGIVTAQCGDCRGRRDAGSEPRGIRIAADRLLLEGSNPFTGSMLNASTSGDAGDGGDLRVDVKGSLELIAEGGLFSAVGASTGAGGEVSIRAGSLRIDAAGAPLGRTGIFNGTAGAGDAGGIDIEVAGLLEMVGPTLIATDAVFGATGDAGDVSIDAGALRMGTEARINGSSFGLGNAGNIAIRARESIDLSHAGGERFSLLKLLLQSVTQAPASVTGVFSATVLGGSGGSLTLEAREIRLREGAVVASSTVGGGDAGDLFLRGETIRVENGAFVDSTSLPVFGVPGGAAGSATLEASRSIEVVGQHPQFGDASRVASATLGSGEVGAVTLRAPYILVDGGVVAAGAVPSPEQQEGRGGGSLTLEARDLEVRGGGLVDASSFVAGPGGHVEVDADRSIQVVGAGSGIASRTGGSGAGGDVTLRTHHFRASDGGEVSARSAAGYGEARRVFASLEDEGLIGAPPLKASGAAGSVRIEASEVELVGGSIATDSAAADGGDVTIEAIRRVHLIDGEITAAVVDGGTGGNITIDPEFVILQHGSRIRADAGVGNGGNIRITADNYFAFPDSVVTASSEFGVDGVVEIQSPDVDLTGALVALPTSFVDASSLVRSPCAASHSEGDAGSFVVSSREGLPPSPDALLPSSAPEAPAAMAESGGERAPSLAPGQLASARQACPHSAVFVR
jgi:filamentous hemagglutinin family protein